MALHYNSEEFRINVAGMPKRHATAFKTISNQQRCVIICRATGKTCLGLLEEGYDTKGFRIHGKSCDWGPMAGFVLRDPRLSKYGIKPAGKGKTWANKNRAEHTEALTDEKNKAGWTASTTPLVISELRRRWLIAEGLINVVQKSDRWDGTATHPSGISFNYSLIPEGDGLWGVYFDNSDPRKAFKQERGTAVVKYPRKYGKAYESMLAMTNSPEHRQFPGENYLNAITGDYDLFAVWPFVKSKKSNTHLDSNKGKAKPGVVSGYDASQFGMDYRPLGTVIGHGAHKGNIFRLEGEFAREWDTETNEPVEGGMVQGTKLGNITERIYLVGQLVNSLVAAGSPTGRQQVIWHSDEAARPALDDLDLPLIAFTPAGNEIGIDTIFDMKVFISFCQKEGICVTLSSAWVQNPNDEFQNRLGEDYSGLVPRDGPRWIVPHWYNA